MSERRASARHEEDSYLWPVAHAARLFAGHAGAPPSAGPWWLSEQGSDPSLLTDTMQTCFLQQLVPSHSLASLADTLQAKRREGGHWLDSQDLRKLYENCGIPLNQWSRLTNLLEKIAILTAART